MTKDQLLQMRDRRPAMPERAEAGEVKIDRNQPPKMRAEEYLRQIKNPYAFKCREVAVNIRFSSDGRSLSRLPGGGQKESLGKLPREERESWREIAGCGLGRRRKAARRLPGGRSASTSVSPRRMPGIPCARQKRSFR